MAAEQFWDQRLQRLSLPYRGGTISIGSAANTGIEYADATVTSAHTYFYVVTAYVAGEGESAFSKEVSATIPAP